MNEHVAMLKPAADATPFDALDFEAPYLIEKLVKDRVVAASAEAEALFTEVKRWLVLARTDESRIWEMYSLRVDEVWHQFILYTSQYGEFCRRFFGHYVHHAPSNAPQSGTATTLPVASFSDFCSRYQELFGVSVPDIWHDERSVTPDRRVRNEKAGMLTLRSTDDMIDLVAESGDVLFSINDFAGEALAFIAKTGAFYVRELPGDLDDDEKVALAATLVECGILRVAG